MEFKSAPGARVDNTYINSSYGFRYLTIFVKDLNKSLAHAEKAGVKPIAKNPQPLPAGFPAGVGIAVFRDPDGNFIELVGPWKKS
jgi:predicted enzyme related to lactoylglutathione lyase